MQRGTDKNYVLGTAHAETDRLAQQHLFWQPQVSDLWARAGFGGGQRLLDAGCGPGFASADLALLTGRSGSVVGVDASADFVAQAQQRCAALGLDWTSFHVADLQREVAAPGGADSAAAFDGIFMRWVLSFVPEPEALVANLATSLAPGGALLLMDYVNYAAVRVFPGAPVLSELFVHFAAANQASGGNYDNAGRAPALVQEHGLMIEYLKPLVHVSRPGERYWSWFRSFCAVFAPRLPEMGLVDADFPMRLEAALAEHEQDPGAFLMTPPVLCLIARR